MSRIMQNEEQLLRTFLKDDRVTETQLEDISTVIAVCSVDVLGPLASKILEHVMDTLKGSTRIGLFIKSCDCIGKLLHRNTSISHNTLTKLSLYLMQQQGFSEQWQAIAMQCLATLAWSAPASVHSAAKEWAVECITKWDYSSNKHAILLLVALSCHGNKQLLSQAVQQLMVVFQSLEDNTISHHSFGEPSSSSLPLPPISATGEKRQHAVCQRAELLVRVVQYSLLFSNSTQNSVAVPINDLVTLICIGAGLQEQYLLLLPWKLLKVVCISCGEGLLPFSDTIEALIGSSLIAMSSITSPPPSLCCLVSECIGEWVKIRKVPSAAFQETVTSSLIVLCEEHLRQLSGGDKSEYQVYPYYNVMLEFLDALIMCYSFHGNVLPEILQQAIYLLAQRLCAVTHPPLLNRGGELLTALTAVGNATSTITTLVTCPSPAHHDNEPVPVPVNASECAVMVHEEPMRESSHFNDSSAAQELMDVFSN